MLDSSRKTLESRGQPRLSYFWSILSLMTALDLTSSPVCVTGGAGFIGSHLVSALVRSGVEVRVLDDLSTGAVENLATVLPDIRFIEGSILDPDALTEAFAGAGIVFHHAARVSVAESVTHPERYEETNVQGTRAVLEAARSLGVRRLVYAGSCSAYGDLPGLPKHETDPVQPTSPYAASKLSGEELVADHGAGEGFDTARLRYFNVYGPGQAHDSAYAAAIPKFVHCLRSGEQPIIFGDGGQTRDFVHVSDVVQANLLAAAHDGPLGGAVFNVGSASARSILEVLGIIAEAFGVEASPRHEEARPGEVRDSLASIALAADHLGYAPGVDFRDGLLEMVSGLV